MAGLLSVVFLVPLTGSLVRYRVSYDPKAPIQLDGESGESGTGDSNTTVTNREPRQSPTLFGMFKRVYRMQGVGGLSKGIMPTLLYGLLTILNPYGIPRLYMHPSPSTSGLSLKSALIYSMFYLPIMVTVYRAITTTHELGSWKPRESIRLLFTEYERKKPWTIYLIPGLVPAFILNLLICMLALQPVNRLLLGRYIPQTLELELFVRLGLSLLASLLATVFLAPLEVVTTRLAIQRTYGVPLQTDAGQADDIVDAEKGTVSASLDNEPDAVVVKLRDETDPYKGLIDAVKKINAEEGWSVLYRGAVLTFLGAYFTG